MDQGGFNGIFNLITLGYGLYAVYTWFRLLREPLFSNPLLIPKERANEYYGFFDIFGRYASVMGTLLVSVVTSLTGNPSLGVLSIGILLVVGLVMLVKLSTIRGMA